MYNRILSLFSAVPYSAPTVSADKSTSTYINEGLAAHLTNTSLQTQRGEAGVRLLDELIGCHIVSSTPVVPTVQQERRSRQPRPPRAMGEVMDVEQLRSARPRHSEQASPTAEPNRFTPEDVEDIKSQVADVLAETFKAALDMSVHFQVGGCSEPEVFVYSS